MSEFHEFTDPLETNADIKIGSKSEKSEGKITESPDNIPKATDKGINLNEPDESSWELPVDISEDIDEKIDLNAAPEEHFEDLPIDISEDIGQDINLNEKPDELFEDLPVDISFNDEKR